MTLTAVGCSVPTTLAIYAWRTHWDWLATGAYAHNSFPMNAFAVETTWIAAIVDLLAVTAWAGVLWRVRIARRQAAKMSAIADAG